MAKIRRFFTLFLCQLFLLLNAPVSAEDIQIDALLDKAEALTEGKTDVWEEFDAITEKLRLEKNRQNEIIRTKTLAIEEKKELLKALGSSEKKEGEENVEESSEIKNKRKAIQDKIQNIDTDIKTAQLNIARIDDLIGNITSKRQNKRTAQLLNYTPFVTHFDNTSKAVTEAIGYITKPHDTTKIILASILFLIMILAAFIAPKHIQKFLNDNQFSSDRIITKRLFLQIAFSAFFILSLRFNIISLLEYPFFRASLQMIFGSILGISLFEFLGCTDFRQTGQTTASYSSVVAFKNRVKKLLRFISILTVPVGLIGYTELSSFISLNILSTIAAVLFFIFARRALVKISTILNEKKNHLFSYEKDTELSPLAIIIFEPLLAFVSLSMILFFWGVTSQDFAVWIAEYKNGFYVGNIFIDFNIIGLTIILFFGVIAFTKLIQWFLEKRVFVYTNLDTGLQNTTITVTGYIGFLMAFLSASNALGLNMANLAIVAGALSVGIGFGLQTIFNNFVSGIILLFERPFKVGDWVTVGGNEGFVKKIKVRSTELETFSKVSLIVPNSVMIGETVQNLTLHNATGRITVAVGVAYGSDTEKVKDLLMQAAQAHPNVTQFPESHVIFAGFGDSSLNFEVRCYIDNVIHRLQTASDLRFAIDKAFREHNIEIPFPQRDIHIKTTVADKNI